MGTETTDFAGARDRMVDGQIRPNKVIDPRIIQAMRRIPRERFLPPGLGAQAYIDDDVALPHGRAFPAPMVTAKLVQLLRLHQNETVLVVAAGAGYGAVLAEACCGAVTALEEDPELLARARAALLAADSRVKLVEGPVTAGWPPGAPYDAILIEGAVPTIPHALGPQLKPGGRIAAVISRGGPGQGVLAEAVHLGPELRLRAQPFFDANTTPLPQFKPLPAFTF